MITGTHLAAQQAREDFEHSKASKWRKRVELFMLGSAAFGFPIATAWVMS